MTLALGYDPWRQVLVGTMPREPLIELIARHLQQAGEHGRGSSLQQMYGVLRPRHFTQPTRKTVRRRRSSAMAGAAMLPGANEARISRPAGQRAVMAKGTPTMVAQASRRVTTRRPSGATPRAAEAGNPLATTAANPGRSRGASDEAISDGPPGDGEAVAEGMGSARQRLWQLPLRQRHGHDEEASTV